MIFLANNEERANQLCLGGGVSDIINLILRHSCSYLNSLNTTTLCSELSNNEIKSNHESIPSPKMFVLKQHLEALQLIFALLSNSKYHSTVENLSMERTYEVAIAHLENIQDELDEYAEEIIHHQQQEEKLHEDQNISSSNEIQSPEHRNDQKSYQQHNFSKFLELDNRVQFLLSRHADIHECRIS
jgi:hypothetical protein